MNTETAQHSSSNSPAGAVKKHWIRPFIYLLLYLALAGLWSYYSFCCIRSGGDKTGHSTGSGGGGGKGQGGSDSGSGYGADSSGSGSGKQPQVPVKPAAGSGNSSGETGSSGKQSHLAPTGKQSNTVQAAASDPNDSKQIESISNQQAAPKVKSGNAGNVAGHKGFYGVITSNSTRSIFIVDTSSSMGSLSGEVPYKPRVEVLRTELKKSIFNPHRKNIGGFIIFAFNSDFRRFPEKNLCRYSNTQAMNKAQQFIDSLLPEGGTMMKQVWKKALETAEKEKIDTIYFMTDGQPGDGFSDQWLLTQLKKYSLKKLKIHCISVGMDQQFMQKISDHTRGTYTYIP